MRKNKIMAAVSAVALAASCNTSFCGSGIFDCSDILTVSASEPSETENYQREYEEFYDEENWMMFYVYSDHAVLHSCALYGSEKIVIPDEVNGVPVTSINFCTFQNCTELEEIVIPDTITDIGREAFKNTPWLEKKRSEDPMVIVNGMLIDGSTCSGDVVIPETVKTICDGAFAESDELVSVIIPDTVENMGYEVFWDCKKLKKVVFPDNMTEVKAYTFFCCENLETVDFPAELETVGYLAFAGCNGFKNFVFPDTVTKIDSQVFEGCTGLESVKLPASLTEIAFDAFRHCDNLKEIIVPESVTCIDDDLLDRLYGRAPVEPTPQNYTYALPEFTITKGAIYPVDEIGGSSYRQTIIDLNDEKTVKFIGSTDTHNEGVGNHQSGFVYALNEGKTRFTLEETDGRTFASGGFSVTEKEACDPETESQEIHPVMICNTLSSDSYECFDKAYVLYDDGSLFVFSDGRYLKIRSGVAAIKNIKGMSTIAVLDKNGILSIDGEVISENVKELGRTRNDILVYSDNNGKYFDAVNNFEMKPSEVGELISEDPYVSKSEVRFYSHEETGLPEDITVTSFEDIKMYSVRNSEGTEIPWFFGQPLTHVKRVYGRYKYGDSMSVLLEREDGTVWKYNNSSMKYTRLDTEKLAAYETAVTPKTDPKEENKENTAAVPTAKPVSEYAHGDVNLDGIIDLSDLSDLALILVDKKLPDDDHYRYGDVDYDGNIDLADLVTLRQFLSKKITSLPAPKDQTYPTYEERKKAREQVVKKDPSPTPSSVPTGTTSLPSNAP